jgi:hypothetical protein
VFKESSSKIEFLKQPLVDRTETSFTDGDLRIRWTPAVREDLLSGETLRGRLLRLAYFGDWERFFRTLREFIEWSFGRWSLDSGALQGAAWDATWVNAYIDPSAGYSLFDLEWTGESPSLSKSFFIFRNVLLLSRVFEYFGERSPYGSLKHLFLDLCHQFGIDAQYDSCVALEARFQQLIGGGEGSEAHRGVIILLMERPKPSFNGFQRTPSEVFGRMQKFEMMESRVRDLEKENEQKDREIKVRNELIASLPVRISLGIDRRLRKLPWLHQWLRRAGMILLGLKA